MVRLYVNVQFKVKQLSTGTSSNKKNYKKCFYSPTADILLKRNLRLVHCGLAAFALSPQWTRHICV